MQLEERAATQPTGFTIADEIVANDRRYVLHSWSNQSQINPLPIAGAEGRYFWDYSGKRYLDFAWQLINTTWATSTPA